MATPCPAAEATNAALLKAYAVLTHRIHAASRGPRQDARLEFDLRDQRDVVETEILRRMGAGHE